MLVKASTVALAHQLQQEVMQQHNKNIPQSGAVLDINIQNKEKTNMVEKLQAYLAELAVAAEAVRNRDCSAEIAEKVAAYEAELKAEAAAAKQAELAKLNSDMDCIQKLIQREQESVLA